MSLRARLICLLHCLLALLFVVPLACAAVAEKSLPDPYPAGSAGSAAPCPPSSGYGAGAGAAYGGTNYGTVPTGGGAAPSIGDVWMQYGGARQYYSAQYSARQQYMGGASRIDPACSPLLPPMKAWGAPAAKKVTRARKAAPASGRTVSKSASQVDSKGAFQAGTKAAGAANNTTAKGTTAKEAIADASAAKATPVPATPLKAATPAAAGVKAPAPEKIPLH